MDILEQLREFEECIYSDENRFKDFVFGDRSRYVYMHDISFKSQAIFINYWDHYYEVTDNKAIEIEKFIEYYNKYKNE